MYSPYELLIIVTQKREETERSGVEILLFAGDILVKKHIKDIPVKLFQSQRQFHIIFCRCFCCVISSVKCVFSVSSRLVRVPRTKYRSQRHPAPPPHCLCWRPQCQLFPPGCAKTLQITGSSRVYCK